MEKDKMTIAENEISAQEREILKLMRELDYGQLIISFKSGKPVHVETRKSIALTP